MPRRDRALRAAAGTLALVTAVAGLADTAVRTSDHRPRATAAAPGRVGGAHARPAGAGASRLALPPPPAPAQPVGSSAVASTGSTIVPVQRAEPTVHVAPLRRLAVPDVVAILPRPATARAVRRLERTAGVRAVAVLDRGVVRAGGRRLRAVGVDPGQVRGFTPALTARSTPLWESVARGEVTLAYGVARPFRHQLGRDLRWRGGHGRTATLRLGALASLGLGDAQVVVAHVRAAQLGLRPRAEVVVAAPRLAISTLTAAVHAAFGPRVAVHVRRPEPVTQQVVSATARAAIPAAYLELYQRAATTCPGLSWTVLAGIGAVETGHGSDVHRSSKGAEGPMQFLPSTFAAYGVDANGDGVADIQDPADAVFSAARYLCLNGAGRGGQALYDAIFAYNHADWYVRRVLAYAVAYSR